MKDLGSFLDRYKNFTPPSLVLIRSVRAALLELLHIEVSEKQIKVSHGVAHVAVSGVKKSEITLNKNKLLTAVRREVGEALKDIR